jgi:hypothetical protein
MKIIICSIIIILLLYFSFKFNEHYANIIDNVKEGIIIDIDDKGMLPEFSYNTTKEYNSDFSTNFKSKILFYKFVKDSKIEIEEEYEKGITLGFYLLYPSMDITTSAGSKSTLATTKASPTTSTERLLGNSDSVDTVLSIKSGNIEFILKTYKKENENYEMTMSYKKDSGELTQLDSLTFTDVVLNDLTKLNWFFITLNKKGISFSIKNDPNKTKYYDLTGLNIDEKVTSIVFNPPTNVRYLGRILVFDTNKLDINNICSNYYCGKYKCRFNLKQLKQINDDCGEGDDACYQNSKWNSITGISGLEDSLKGQYDDYMNCVNDTDCDENASKFNNLGGIGATDAKLCIKECSKHEYRCNIKQCQQMCINCETLDDDDNNDMSKSDKMTICPWYTNIKLDMKEPEPPQIRGFPGISSESVPNNGSIIIEWKKPFNNMSKITHYLLEIKEIFSKRPSHKLITLKHNNCDICEYTIINLKNQTTYEIELSAVNSKGISHKSNTLSITTNGNNNEFLNNIYKDISGDNEEYKEYKCVREFDNSDHMLDKVMDEDINVYDYIQSNH